ncbi:11148_t:CDS:2 [Acaulospora morrowiae]|uniref:11148_t:CDS:1 n=1 Tax=Acaulospora morrowiae TaxID=94023 RepID=A0A9N9FB19_9GLOM|nr:11148_t:CDS:2 [Acaulospora morrowiae]
MEDSLQSWTDSHFSNPFSTDSVGEKTLKESFIFETHNKVSRSQKSTSKASATSDAVEKRHRSRLVPVTTHPLSPQTQPSSNVTSSNVQKASPGSQSLTTLFNENDIYSLFKAQGPTAIRKRRSLPGFDMVTDARGNDIGLEKKQMVIVHSVKPSDTLAGVALLYGIECSTDSFNYDLQLSILKRANKLWTSDSIHLRKELYIPLEHCKITADKANVILQENYIIITNRSSALRSSCTSIFNTRNNSSNNIDHVDELPGASSSTMWSSSSSPSSTSSLLSNLNRTDISNFTNYTRAEIQKLPSAQLSYFPPHLSTASSANSNLTFPSSPSPMPVTYLSKSNPHVQVSAVNRLLANLDGVGEKSRKNFDSAKLERKKTTRVELWKNRYESSILLTKKRA